MSEVNYEMLLGKAIEIAAHYHTGQLDKGGHPYILHPQRVAERCHTIKGKIVAWLHDVLEDTKCTIKILREAGFTDELLYDLDCVTKRYGEAYEDFIIRATTSETAREVKKEDLSDNMDIRRLPGVAKKDFERIVKYYRSYAFLDRKMTTKEYLEGAA